MNFRIPRSRRGAIRTIGGGFAYLPTVLIVGAFLCMAVLPWMAVGAIVALVLFGLYMGSLFVNGCREGYQRSVAKRPLPAGIRRVQ